MLCACAGGAAGGKRWYWDQNGKDILEHHKDTLARVNKNKIENIKAKLQVSMKLLKEDREHFKEVLEESDLGALEDTVGSADYIKATEACQTADVTKLESLLCLAIASNNPKKHIVKHTSVFGTSWAVIWHEHVLSDIVELCKGAGQAAPDDAVGVVYVRPDAADEAAGEALNLVPAAGDDVLPPDLTDMNDALFGFVQEVAPSPKRLRRASSRTSGREPLGLATPQPGIRPILGMPAAGAGEAAAASSASNLEFGSHPARTEEGDAAMESILMANGGQVTPELCAIAQGLIENAEHKKTPKTPKRKRIA